MVIFNSYVNVYQMISHGGTPVARWFLWKILGFVVATPLKNMSSSVEMIIPNIWENKKCSKPPTRWKFKPKMLKFWVCGVLGLGLWFLGSTLLKIHWRCWTAKWPSNGGAGSVRCSSRGHCRPLSSHLFGIDECATQAGLNVAKGYLAWKQLQGRKPETHARKMYTCIYLVGWYAPEHIQ